MKERKVTMNFYSNPDKEEAWLNRNAQEGWILSKMRLGGLCAEFERCKPNEYEVRIELTKHPKSSKLGRQYLEFLEETGIECIYSVFGYAYYRKKSDGKPFEIYTDNDSKIWQIKNKQIVYLLMAWTFLVTGILCLVGEIVLLFLKQIVDPWGITGTIVALGLSVLSFFTARLYKKQISRLQQEETAENSIDIGTNKKRKRTVYAFVWMTIAMMVVGGLVGAVIGWLVY